jgi:hypothetical protein
VKPLVQTPVPQTSKQRNKNPINWILYKQQQKFISYSYQGWEIQDQGCKQADFVPGEDWIHRQ